jgi:outer membrane protein insertion porin family
MTGYLNPMNSLVIFARKLGFALALVLAIPACGTALSLMSADSAAAAVASSITVNGNQRIEAETIRTYITIKPGKSYGPADVDASIKVLYNTGLFSDVSIAQRGSTLVITVAENPVVNSVTFEGNKKIKENILSQIIDIKARGVLTDARLQSDVDRIKEYYSRSGRSGASVEPRVTPLGDNRVDVAFVIAEGGRTGVGSIQFVGNKAFTAQRLTGIIQTRKTNWLSWLSKKDVYSEEKLQADQELLRRFYLSHGYADIQVLGADAQFDQAKGKYFVTYTLDEGPKYKFGDVSIDSSIQGVDPKSLMSVVKTRQGKVFNSSDVEKSVENITIELSRLGYVFAQVRPRGDRDYTNHTITLTYVIDEGPRAYVERIDIRGNTKTRDYVIRREFDISEGDAYNRVLVDKAERRLRDLGYFKTVNITTEAGSAPDKVVVVVQVEDQSTGSFSVAAGVSTSDGIIGEIALEETNFLGRGQTVRISVGGGLDGDQNYNLSFTEPYFLGTRVSAGFDAYRTVSKDNGKSRQFDTETTGGGLRVGLPLTDTLNAQLNYKIASTTTSGAAACTGNGEAGCYFPDGDRLTSSAGYALTYSTLDSTLDPHEGEYAKFSQDFAGIGGDSKFMRSTIDARVYRPLGDTDMVAMLKVTGGNILGFGGPVAIADNFFKGGETIRGFAPLGYGPRDANSNTALGGKNYVAGTAEIGFPLPFVPPDFGLRGAVFADAGVLFGADKPAGCPTCTINDDASVRSSVGASILWASPFGQIRVDLAQALTKEAYDDTQFFRIGAGTSF